MSWVGLAVFVVLGVLTLPFYVGVLLLLGALVGYLDWRTSDFVVTDRRVLIRTGVLATKMFELNLAKIESVHVTQPFGSSGRFGDVEIVGTGGSKQAFRRVGDPLGLRRAIHDGADRR